MSEQHYVHKALGEVIRLADEKISQAEDAINRREEELRETTRSCEETISDLSHYFSLLAKQLDRWKVLFTQEIHKNMSDMQSDFRSIVARIQDGLDKLKELRETSAQVLAIGHCSDSELVYQVHGSIFSINQDLDTLAEYVGRCIPLKFVGNLNFDAMQKSDIGTLEHLCDTSCAEILPSKLPKIKLGRLFHLEFRIAKKYCESARKFITYSVTKDEGHTQNVCAYLQDNKNGTYSLSFPITVIVPHTVNVCYLGDHIRNSPYTIAFKVDPNQVVPGPQQQAPALGIYPNSSKEITNDGPTCSAKVIGRAMGDDRDACKRNKWQNPMDTIQQNNNWPNISPLTDPETPHANEDN
ncbi:hypothetical protein CSKR_111547 [Clonorchis sinensis]|uniref:Uncharacterized protein n=1 Tax=Clonorchis sinensis TaxID=79923 RepID=A0A3R7CFD6_CLOSI|nr:hypothetical protein CSKR_104333 [Clonorchis sinensis]KAG5455150.1 hypothetical protein CSKR_111547 [Clonorchis sinensis]